MKNETKSRFAGLQLSLTWIGVFTLLIGVMFSVWWHWPQIRFHAALLQLSAANINQAKASSVREYHFGLNTFNDRVSSKDIIDMYETGCGRLGRIQRNYHTYRYSDLEGYEGVASVIQGSSGHISISVFGGNDSDQVFVSMMPGTFPPPHDPAVFYLNMKELPDHHFPKGILNGCIGQ